MLFTSAGRLHVILAAWLVLRQISASAAIAVGGSLHCDPNTLVIKEKSRNASCSFSLDDASLFAMEESAFYGIDAGAQPSVYSMTKSTLDTLEDGSEETVSMGSLPGDNFGSYLA